MELKKYMECIVCDDNNIKYTCSVCNCYICNDCMKEVYAQASCLICYDEYEKKFIEINL